MELGDIVELDVAKCQRYLLIGGLYVRRSSLLFTLNVLVGSRVPVRFVQSTKELGIQYTSLETMVIEPLDLSECADTISSWILL
jgi:hypothetical protein